MDKAMNVNVGDVYRMPAFGMGSRVWKVDGVFLGGEGQESAVGLRPLDREEPGDTGRLLVPLEILTAARLERC